MWNSIARAIIRYRLALLIFLAVVTAFMLYHARSVHMTYSNPQVIPVTNTKYAEYIAFKKQFGEDGNVLVIGIQTDQLFTTKVFNAWNELAEHCKNVPGVDEVIAIGNSVTFEKDTVNKKMRIVSIFPYHINSQTELDSLKQKFLNLPFYNNLLYNPQTHATLMAVHINSARLNSKARIETVQKIQEYGKLFSEQTYLSIYYSGMPLIRTVMTTQIANETKLFLLLAAITTGLVLFILLRSMNAVIVSMLVVMIAEVWTLGTIHLFGYEITILTGLIPPLVVVIAITNCVYLLNKYHLEFVKHGNKIKALTRIIEKVGLATLFTNLTAAIGFGVFYFTQSEILKEFGLVAGLNIVGIFLISIILIPCIYSFLPAPKEKHTDYLDRIFLNRVLRTLDHLVHHQRKWIFAITILIVAISLGGVFRLQTTGYIVDDIPHKDKLYTDLQFFEQNFHGVMPLEILVDTRKKAECFLLQDWQRLISCRIHCSSSMNFQNHFRLWKE
jgi:predicted RND superfamily exporter protein